MALITIPTSIAGVSIPGAAVNGPLGALFGNKYKFPILQYPRDLSSATRGHVIEFTIHEVKEANFSELTSWNANLSGIVNDANQSVAEKGLNILSQVTDKVNNTLTQALQNVNLSLNPRTKTTVGAVSLYIPDTMAVTYNVNYDDSIYLLDLGLSAASGIAGAMAGRGADSKNKDVRKAAEANLKKYNKASALATSAGAKNAGKLLMSTQGLAINPQQQLLFNGITFRDFQLVFTFTPYSQEEASQVVEIIKTFKKHSLPTITESAAGMFYKIPSSFDMKFLFDGQENKKISKVATSVLTNVDVNYTPNGWSTYSDGTPIQTILTLNFKEIELVDRNKVEKEGY